MARRVIFAGGAYTVIEDDTVHELTANDVESASEVSAPALGTEGVDGLSASNVQCTSEVGAPALGQVHDLTASDVEVLSEVSSPSLDDELHSVVGVHVVSGTMSKMSALSAAA